MKRICLILTALALCLTLVPAYAAGEMAVSSADFKSAEGYDVRDSLTVLNNGGYFGFAGVDLSGIKSVTVKAKCSMPYGTNGDTLAVVLDDPKKGGDIGYVLINSEYETEFSANIKETAGKHDVYFVSCYGNNFYNSYISVEFNKEAVKNELSPVPDEKIIDHYSDTWALTDSLGREAASYAEAGEVKTGDHYVGMMYWNWHSSSDTLPLVISEVIKNHPEAKEDYSNSAWGTGETWWDEPVLGFYSGEDYFVYRRHAAMLAAAGVDFLLFDYTNVDMTFTRNLNVMLKAFHDSREAGVNVPKLSAYFGGPQNAASAIKSFRMNFLGNEDYSDLWFIWDGKPAVVIRPLTEIGRYIVNNSERDKKLIQDIYSKITVRTPGNRQNGQDGGTPAWIWLENYPLHEWGAHRDDGRVEAMTVGVSINHSYVYNYTYTGVASDPYTKGRAYTEGFGEGDDPRSGAFFREQSAQVLDVDPAIVIIDGWNEFKATRQQNYAGFKNAFVDTFDSENSRDLEPVKGFLKDDGYVMLVDFIRKYKGVRPAPPASEEKTIDISGSPEQWSGVLPEYLNYYDAYERTDKGQGAVYEGRTVNSIESAKVARDGEKIYFLVKCRGNIDKTATEFLHLYINSDRNYATGREGYDFAAGRTKGALEKYEDGSWVKVADLNYTVTGEYLMLEIPRAVLNLGEELNFEFKWVDSAGEIASGDILDLYKTGSAAPLGRFNYVYTEKAEKTLSSAERGRLYGTAVFKAGSSKMNVSGARMDIYTDRKVTAVESGGTLYIPYAAFEDVLYGESKAEYDPGDNTLHLSCFDLEERDIKNELWTYSVLGSFEAKVNGRAKALSHPTALINGIICIPVTYFSDCLGFELYEKDGVYAVSRYGKAPESDVLAAADLLD